MFALDYDGVIADTNQLISEWLRGNMGLDRPRYRCDWSQLCPVIGEERYREMGRVIYWDEYTAKADILPGAEAALEALSAAGPLYLITARNEELTTFSRAWLDKRDLTRHFADILSMGDRLKVDIAKDLGCKVLVDDDQRHLIPGVIEHLVLFRPSMGEPVHQLDGCTVCSTWEDALEAMLGTV